MTVEYIRYRIDADRRDAFVAAYRVALTALDDSEYCLGYQLAQCEEEPDKFILPIRPFVDDIEEMQHYEVLEGRDSDPSASSRRAT